MFGFFLSCSEPAHESARQVPVSLPDVPTRGESEHAKRFTQIEKLYDLFDFTGFVKLKESDGFYLTEISEVLLVDKHWVVRDLRGKQVLVFNIHGQFVQRLGKTGEGPGEYKVPHNIAKVYDDGIAVKARGKIIVYEISGEVRTELHSFKDVDNLIISTDFIWNEPNELWLFDVTVQDEKSTAWNHVRLTRDDHSAFQIVNQFGSRFFGYKNRTGSYGNFPWTAIAQVGGETWVGSPFTSWINIYDQQARYLAKLPTPVANGLTYEDFTGVNYKKKMDAHERVFAKFRNIGIVPINERMILTSLFSFRPLNGMLYNLYDRKGQLIKGGLYHRPNAKLHIYGAENGLLYGNLGVFFGQPEKTLRRFLYPAELAGVKKAGWVEGAESNFYIWTGRLKPEVTAALP